MCPLKHNISWQVWYTTRLCQFQQTKLCLQDMGYDPKGQVVGVWTEVWQRRAAVCASLGGKSGGLLRSFRGQNAFARFLFARCPNHFPIHTMAATCSWKWQPLQLYVRRWVVSLVDSCEVFVVRTPLQYFYLQDVPTTFQFTLWQPLQLEMVEFVSYK